MSDKLNKPIFLKSNSSLKTQLKQLESIFDKLEDKDKNDVKIKMRILRSGISGENQIAFELANSDMPMYIIRDLHIECDGLAAQIDFMVITKKLVYVIESKNMIGDVEINANGDFIRKFILDGQKIEECIYSPVTQNMRHLNIVKKLRTKSKPVAVASRFEEKFLEMYKSLVVLPNSKTILTRDKNHESDVVIKADQLINYIKDMDSKSRTICERDSELMDIAIFFLKQHTEPKINYIAKYNIVNDIVTKKPIDLKEYILADLRTFRKIRANEDHVPPYAIFNNKQMETLINEIPATFKDLAKLSGFTERKINKYGIDILKILNDYRN